MPGPSIRAIVATVALALFAASPGGATSITVFTDRPAFDAAVSGAAKLALDFDDVDNRTVHPTPYYSDTSGGSAALYPAADGGYSQGGITVVGAGDDSSGYYGSYSLGYLVGIKHAFYWWNPSGNGFLQGPNAGPGSTGPGAIDITGLGGLGFQALAVGLDVSTCNSGMPVYMDVQWAGTTEWVRAGSTVAEGMSGGGAWGFLGILADSPLRSVRLANGGGDYPQIDNLEVAGAATPEPASCVLLAFGVLGLRRRRRPAA